MSGQYSVTNCEENTTRIVDLLDRLHSALLPVIQDAQSANPSAAYKTFFKDPSYAPFISTLLTNITTGVPMTPPSLHSYNGGVTFVCVTAPAQFTFTLDGRRDAYNDCIAQPGTTSKYVGFDPPKQYVVLCPSFFTSNIAPVPRPNTCLTVNKFHNRFRGNGQIFRLYQMWVLMEMITHYYLYTSSRELYVTDTNDVNECFRLEANQSSLNANNYVYYAASIHGHCRGFPTAGDSGRELLGIDILDLSGNNGTDDASPAAVTDIATDLELGGEDATSSP